MTTRIRLPRLLEKRRNKRVLARERQGFSIIELVTVIAIIGIMALGGLAVFKVFRRSPTAIAARDVTNIMRLARQKAIIKRQDYLAVYDLKNERVWVQDPRGPDGKPGIAGVDDDNNGVIDDTGELGTAGSDDFNASDPNTWSPEFGTVQSLPDKAIIARITAGDGGLATGTEDPSSDGTDDYKYSDKEIGYHKFSPNSTVDDYTESGYSIKPTVWLKDERLVDFYKVELIPQTARAKIYSSW